MTTNLESKLLYRLIRVLHYFSQGIFIVVVIAMLFEAFPSAEIPDNKKSYIVCDNGKRSRPISETEIEIDGYNRDLKYPYADKAKRFCVKDSNGNVTDQVVQAILRGRLPRNAELRKNYSLHIEFQPRDWLSYINEVSWYLIAYICFYVVGNVVRESIVYVAYGKKFDLKWIKIIPNNARIFFNTAIKSPKN